MSDNPYYSQGGQLPDRPVKKRQYRFIKILSVLLVIAILSMTLVNYFLEPVLLSRLTKGYLFGFHTTQVTEAELENPQNMTTPTVKEIRDYSRFAKKLSNRIYLSLSSEQKEDVNEIKAGAKQISAHISKNDSAQTPVEKSSLTASTPEKTNTSFNKSIATYLNFDLASVALGGLKGLEIEAENTGKEDAEDTLNPEILNDISAFLYANGYPELASAVSSMAAADYPLDPISALNFATVLREVNANDDAFNVLQYALRLSPDSEPILYSLGMCALELKKTSLAQNSFSRILSLNGSSGPGHQGMMLCYMDSGNYATAFLHMLEGAREGYTTMVTETYKALRAKNEEYIDIAKPILEQYTFEQLLDFSKSRTPFDSTLDSPAGQLDISRDINLGTDSVSVYSASDKLQEGLQYAMSAYSYGKATFDDAYNMVMGVGGLANGEDAGDTDELTKTISKLILEKVFGSAANGSTVSSDGWLGISYEAEVFWLNILDDYVQIKLEDNLEEYFEKPYEEALKNPDSVNPSLMQYNETLAQLCESNPLQVGSTVLNNLINNNSVYDTGVQKANKEDMDKFLEAVNPKLEEGYKKAADLMEEYWLHYGSILGQIGNDETYNRYQQSRKTTIASALTPYVVGGTINCFLVTMNFIAVDSDNQGGGGQITYPDFPEFPDSQMGDPYEPPKPPQDNSDDNTGSQDDSPPQDEGSSGQQEENPGSGDNSPQTGEPEPPKPGPGNPGTGDITTENSGTIFVGPLSATYNDTGWELDLTAVGSVNLRYDARTGDLSLFGGIGLSAGMATSGLSARTGVYTTINTDTMNITSGARSTMDGQLAGNGISVEKQTCITTGADTTTVSAILLHKKSTQTIYNN